MHRFRFGIVAGQAGSAQSWSGLARRVESRGYSSLLVPDTVHTLAPTIACAVAAAVTTSLRVGPYVLAAPNRTPGQVALETRTLATLTEGRYELGIGAGRESAESDAAVFGMPFGSARDRMAAVEATVARVREANGEVRVLVAATGPRMLGMAGRIADIVALGLPPAAGEQAAETAVGHVRAGAGDRFGQVELSQNLLCVGDQAPSWLSQYLKADLGELIAGGSVSVLTGTVDEKVATLQERRDRFGISYVCTNAAFMDALAPVVERLAGS